MILRGAIDHYVAWRRAHGARFITTARALYQFCRSVPEHVCCDAVTEKEVRQFLAGTGPLTRWRAGKYGALAGFYRYAISRGYATRSPLPAADEEPREPPSTQPYIYSREELRHLFEAVNTSRKHAVRLDSDTFRTPAPDPVRSWTANQRGAASNHEGCGPCERSADGAEH